AHGLVNRRNPDLALAAAARDPDLLAHGLEVAGHEAAFDAGLGVEDLTSVAVAEADSDSHRVVAAELREADADAAFLRGGRGGGDEDEGKDEEEGEDLVEAHGVLLVGTEHERPVSRTVCQWAETGGFPAENRLFRGGRAARGLSSAGGRECPVLPDESRRD